MKVYIICDIEGTAGVVDFARQCIVEGAEYDRARRAATDELNAAVEGALAGGATYVVAWDGHGPYPGGIDPFSVHKRCELVTAAGAGGPIGMDGSFDAMIMVGLHARAGTPGGVLAHSFNDNVASLTINGQQIGEIGMGLLQAGQHGVPAVLVTGDAAACREATALEPGIRTATVKEGLSEDASDLMTIPTRTLSPAAACALIRERAEDAVRNHATVRPFALGPPYQAKIVYHRPGRAAEMAKRPNVELVDQRTIVIRSDSLSDLEV